MMTFINEHQDWVVFGLIGLAVVILVKVLGKRTQTPADASAAETDATAVPQTVYLPTSETYITSTSNEVNSNNSTAPGAPYTVNSPSTTTTTGPVTSTTTTTTPPPVIINNPPANIPSPPPSTTPVGSVDATTPQTPRPKDPAMTVEESGGWWHRPGDMDNFWLQRTGHYLSHGFHAYYNKNGMGAAFGGPVSEEYNDPTNGSVRQDFEKGTMFWKPGSDPANYDVKWVSKGGAGGSAVLPLSLGQPGAPPRTTPYLATPPAPTGVSEHIVRPGQTLSDLGEIYSVEWQKIYAANRAAIDSASHALGNPIPGGPWNNVVAGMRLKIPAY